MWWGLVHCTSLLSWSRYFKYMQIYVHPMGHREVIELVSVAGRFPVEREVKWQRYESQTVSRGWKYCKAEDSGGVQMEYDSNS